MGIKEAFAQSQSAQAKMQKEHTIMQNHGHPPTSPLPQDPLGKFRHYKGGLYEVLFHARHSETEEELVVYKQLDKDTGWWTRPRAMFFGTVVVGGEVKQRFIKIQD
jgi:hypothetical protein